MPDCMLGKVLISLDFVGGIRSEGIVLKSNQNTQHTACYLKHIVLNIPSILI